MRRVVGPLLFAVFPACRGEPEPLPLANTAAPALPAASSAAPPSARAPSAEPAPSEAAPEPAGRAAPVGGNWLRCYSGFQPRTRPDLDVLRLGMMCGPSNGMKRLTVAKDVDLGAAAAPREHRWQAEAGDCYRIFAVAEPSVEDLDVEVFDPAGKRIAFDTSDDRWPIVKPDGAFCAFGAGEYRAAVRAQRGAGKYAIEIWRLR